MYIRPSPPFTKEALTVVSSLSWRGKGELLQLPWTSKSPGHFLIIADGDVSISFVFAVMEFGFLVTLLIGGLSEEMVSRVKFALPDAFIIDDIHGLSWDLLVGLLAKILFYYWEANFLHLLPLFRSHRA